MTNLLEDTRRVLNLILGRGDGATSSEWGACAEILKEVIKELERQQLAAQAKEGMMDDTGMTFRCPDCGFTAHLFAFDALGVPDGSLACPQCHHVGPMIECGAAKAKEDE